MQYHNILNYRYKLHSIIKASYRQYYYPCKWDNHNVIAHYNITDIQAWILREAIQLRILIKTYLETQQLPFHLGLTSTINSCHIQCLFDNTSLKMYLHKDKLRFSHIQYQYGLHCDLHTFRSESATISYDIGQYVDHMIDIPLHSVLYRLIEQRYLMNLYQHFYENNDDRTHAIEGIMYGSRSNLALP